MAPFYLGHFSRKVTENDIRHITNPAETEELENGDVVEILDRIFEWDEDCVKASTLESWRARGDDSCDAALAALFPSPSSSVGIDLLSALETAAASEAHSPGPATHFLAKAREPIPAHIDAPTAQILRAQHFFWSNLVPIMTSLLHFSLAGGFASPRITKVLNLSSYLIPPHARPGKQLDGGEDTQAAKDRTFQRLNETAQFVLEVMGAPPPPMAHPPAPRSSAEGKEKEEAPAHCLLPEGEGWRSCLRVRMLHATVRRRILSRLSSPSHSTLKYSLAADGLTVNQEDLAATLGSFSAAPLVCMTQLGWPTTEREREDFVALWRVVGYHLGVEVGILERHFMTFQQASKFVASCVIHLLDFSHTEEGTVPPTIPILKAVSGRPPFRTGLAYHMALTRRLLGPKLADHLGVERTSWEQAIRLRVSLFVSRYPGLFGRVYPRKGWERKRVRLVREAVRRLTRFNLGLRKTSYRPRDAETPELEERVREVEKVVPDFEGGRTMVREWREMMLEMGVVSVGVVGLLGVGMWMVVGRIIGLV